MRRPHALDPHDPHDADDDDQGRDCMSVRG
jgi:hypothetical protein